MDPISHVIFGRTLIALDSSRRLGAAGVVACVLGALAPDVDAVFMPLGWDVYLIVHQIGTHSVIGSLAVAAATAAVVFFASAPYVVRTSAQGAPYVSLWLAAWIGTLSHLSFDLLSGATLQLFWPFSGRQSSVPLVAMADPWLVSVCAIGAVALWIGKRRMKPIACGILLTIGVFLALKAALMTAAVGTWRRDRGHETVVHHAVEAEWGSLTRWIVVDRTPLTLRKWRVNAFGGATLLLSIPLPDESPIVAVSRTLDTVRNFLHVHPFGFALSVPLEKGGTRVLWSDIRYCWSGTECGLWFGGMFDRDGLAVTQIVLVGDWRQSRPAGP